MVKRFPLVAHGPRLWTRELARRVRADLYRELETLRSGDCLVVDMEGVETFDYSFANELFGRTLLGLTKEFPGTFFIVENLTEYTRENLENALSCIGLMIIEKAGGTLRLLGKVHPADEETFDAIIRAHGPVTASGLKEQLGVGLTAMNERLSKLLGLGLLRRERIASAAGREQYRYFVPS
jgi:hypothetical protein